MKKGVWIDFTSEQVRVSFGTHCVPSALTRWFGNSLHSAGVQGPGLGGLRHTTKESLNTGWRNASFRGYADYMQTPEFEKALKELIQLANQDRLALMCAEALPWRCHRSLIGDALLVRGIQAEDIMSVTQLHVHALTPFAKVTGTHIIYE